MAVWEIHYIDRSFNRHQIKVVADRMPTMGAAAVFVQAKEFDQQLPDPHGRTREQWALIALLREGLVVTKIAPELIGGQTE